MKTPSRSSKRVKDRRHLASLMMLGLSTTMAGYSVVSAPVNSDMGEWRNNAASVVVGASAAVPENEYNRLSTALKERAAELDAKEAELNARGETDGSSGDLMTKLSLLASLVLLVLTLLNFYFDWRRGSASRRTALKEAVFLKLSP